MENQDIHDIDNLFRDSLGNLEVPYEKASWARMQEKLEASANGQIDETVRLALGDLVVPYEAGSWKAMRDRMSKTEAAQVDEAARKAVGNLIIPYNARSWGVLLERLQAIEYRRRIIALKVLEAAVIVLALITVVQFMGVESTPLPHQERVQRSDFAATDTDHQDKSDSKAAIVDIDQKDKVNSEVARKEAVVSTSSGTVAETSTAQVEFSPSSSKVQVVGDIVAAKTEVGVVDKIDSEIVKEQASEIFVANKTSVGSVANSSATPVAEKKATTSDFTILPNVAFTVDHDNVESITVWEDSPASAEELHQEALGIVSKSSKVKTRIGLYSQFSRHSTSAPHPNKIGKFLTEDKIDPLGIGFIANVQFGRIGFDFGLAHERLTFLTSARRDKNTIRKVQLPLHIRYNVFQKDDLKAYVKGGVVANGVVLANYAGLDGTSSAPGIQTNDSQEKKYKEGLLNQGLADNNVYWMTSMALGVEGKLAGNFTVFAEAQQQKHLHGSIGHHATKFGRSRSLQLGLLYQFN